MNTKKGIAIGLAAVMISMIAACAVPMVGADESETNATYTVTISEYGAKITVTANQLGFGTMQKGSDSTISDSLTITNSGDKHAKVEARFSTNVDGVYGLTNGTSAVIPASNFEVGKTNHLKPLNDDDSEKDLGGANKIPKYGSVNYDAKLNVPNVESIIVGVYSGTVELIFTSD